MNVSALRLTLVVHSKIHNGALQANHSHVTRVSVPTTGHPPGAYPAAPRRGTRPTPAAVPGAGRGRRSPQAAAAVYPMSSTKLESLRPLFYSQTARKSIYS